MAVNPQEIIAVQQLTNGFVTYYTSSNIKTRVDKLTFTNTDTVAHQVTVARVASGGTAGTTNTVTSSHSVAPGETWPCPEMVGKVLPVGGFIAAKADTGAVVNIDGAGSLIST